MTIPKANGKIRRLGIATVADRVVQASLKLVLEPAKHRVQRNAARDETATVRKELDALRIQLGSAKAEIARLKAGAK